VPERQELPGRRAERGDVSARDLVDAGRCPGRPDRGEVTTQVDDAVGIGQGPDDAVGLPRRRRVPDDGAVGGGGVLRGHGVQAEEHRQEQQRQQSSHWGSSRGARVVLCDVGRRAGARRVSW
jgi:hypothetical protein